jgi:putative MFS transporter
VVRNRVMLASQGVTALVSVVSGILAYYWIPDHYRAYIYVMAAFQLFFLVPLLAWRMPESPRWLEAAGKHDKAERVMAKLEQRTERAFGAPLAPPDPNPLPLVEAGHALSGFKELFSNPLYRNRTVLLLIAWVLGYGGIIYGTGAFAAVYMADHGAGPQFVFGLITISAAVRFVAFQGNAFLGDRFERRDVILALSVLFAVSWFIMYQYPNLPTMAIFYTIGGIGSGLWLFNMYNYTAISFPTRLRSIGMGTADGLGHIGSWISVSKMGTLYDSGSNHLGWILFITLPGALLPSLAIRFLGVKQRNAVLEKVST